MHFTGYIFYQQSRHNIPPIPFWYNNTIIPLICQFTQLKFYRVVNCVGPTLALHFDWKMEVPTKNVRFLRSAITTVSSSTIRGEPKQATFTFPSFPEVLM